MSANFTFAGGDYSTVLPDPTVRPELFDGVLARRVLAYAVDLFFIGSLMLVLWCFFAVLTLLSFGLLGPLLHLILLLVPIAYHSLFLSGSHGATPGMRLFDITLRSWTAERPSFLQALAQTVLFYATIAATCSLILLLALFNRRKRTLHDVLAGTLIVRAHPLRWSAAGAYPRR